MFGFFFCMLRLANSELWGKPKYESTQFPLACNFFFQILPAAGTDYQPLTRSANGALSKGLGDFLQKNMNFSKRREHGGWGKNTHF